MFSFFSTSASDTSVLILTSCVPFFSCRDEIVFSNAAASSSSIAIREVSAATSLGPSWAGVTVAGLAVLGEAEWVGREEEEGAASEEEEEEEGG